MPYKAALKSVFAQSDVRRVAIVDDAFDPVDLGELDRDAVTAMQAELRDLDNERAQRPDLAAQVEGAMGMGIAELADKLREKPNLESLWRSYIDADPLSEFYGLLGPLFAKLGTDLRDKLKPLRALKALLLEMDGVAVDEFGSDATAANVADHQLIFLDYFLNNEVPETGNDSTRAAEKLGRERSIAFLADLVGSRPDNLPLVMLISSRAKAGDLPDFRRETKMLASKMNFLPKDFALSDPPRAQHSIMGLVKHTKHADALASLLKTWSEAVAHASETMMISIRELDLTDYSYIQQYRLAGEKTPLAQYIAWLFNGRLTDLVEAELREKKAEKIVDAFTLPEAIPGRASPTKAITELFSAATTTRTPVGHEKFEPVAWAGDIFLDTAKYNEIFRTRRPAKRVMKSYPQVLTVVTPACDLVPDRAINNPLKTVTMIGGELVGLADADAASNHLLMLNGKPFVVRWNTKWPMTFPVEAVSPKQGPHDRYQWVGRYRDVYHAELQHRLLQDLGRPALPIAPTMPFWVPFKVLVRVGRRPTRYETILAHTADDQLAWTWMGDKEKMFALREELVWTIRGLVRDRCATLGEADRNELGTVIDAPSFVDDLQLPIAMRKDSGELACGAGVAKAANIAQVDGGLKPLVLVFGTGILAEARAAA